MAELTDGLDVNGKGIANRFTVVEGPVKKEIINLRRVATGDTVVSRLQRPTFGSYVAYGAGDTQATVVAFGTSSAAAIRTATLTNATDLSGATDDNGVLTVYGF